MAPTAYFRGLGGQLAKLVATAEPRVAQRAARNLTEKARETNRLVKLEEAEKSSAPAGNDANMAGK